MDKKEVAQFLNVSLKTVERYVKSGKLKVVYINSKGQYDEAEVLSLKEDMETPVHRAIVDNSDRGDKELSVVVALDGQAEILECLRAIALHYRLGQKMLLTIPEAVVVSGLSKAGLRDAVKSKRLKAIKQGGAWKVRIGDLEDYVQRLFNLPLLG